MTQILYCHTIGVSREIFSNKQSLLKSIRAKAELGVLESAHTPTLF